MTKKNHPTTHPSPMPLKVWADRRAEPDWDRFVAALVALALERVDQEDETEGERE